MLLTPSDITTSIEELQSFAPSEHLCRLGSVPVLVTSVHGFAHMRDNQRKSADNGSLEFSYLLAKAIGCSWMAVHMHDMIDSNYHSDTPFKRDVAKLVEQTNIQLVIDIHGAHAYRPFDVDVGTLKGESWRGNGNWNTVLLDNLRNCGFLATDNAYFNGGVGRDAVETMVSFCNKIGVPAVQLEISSAYLAELETRLSMHLRLKLLYALSNFTESVIDSERMI
ncbi:hypothetical protein [Massilia sp. LjRoot122]|uniref:hypothetical protein n=1 Tax=Massilia sp. LjRoot122 TaxID=3342257 RepID=UPI003ECD4B78